MKLLNELALPGCFLAIFWAVVAIPLIALGAPDIAVWIALFWVVLGATPGAILSLTEAWKEW